MNGKYFTKEEESYLKENYPHMNTSSIAEHLGRNIFSVYNKAYVMGLKKTEGYLQSEASGRLKGNVGINSRFKKGQTPWNKGKKMTTEQYEKAAPTMFRKGNKPHNTKYDGYISVRKSRKIPYAWIRVSEGKFRLLHRVLWERYNGRIPKGYNVVFKDGNQANISLDNLELVSDSELMNRNNLQRYPEDIKKLILANAKLKREINKIINNE